MRPNMDLEIAVLQSVLANANEPHQLKAGLAQAVKLLAETSVSLSDAIYEREDAREGGRMLNAEANKWKLAYDKAEAYAGLQKQALEDIGALCVESGHGPADERIRKIAARLDACHEIVRPQGRHGRGCFNDSPGASLCQVCGGDLPDTRTAVGPLQKLLRIRAILTAPILDSEYRIDLALKTITIALNSSELNEGRPNLPESIRGALDLFGTAAKDYGVALATNPPGSTANHKPREECLAARERVDGIVRTILSQGTIRRPARFCPACSASGDQVGEVGAACWTKGCDGVIASGMKP